MDSNQKYFPDFGYDAPRKIKGVKECENPAFANHRLHRIGIFKDEYLTDGAPGWVVTFKCVNCGREVDSAFMLDGTVGKIDQQIFDAMREEGAHETD